MRSCKIRIVFLRGRSALAAVALLCLETARYPRYVPLPCDLVTLEDLAVLIDLQVGCTELKCKLESAVYLSHVTSLIACSPQATAVVAKEQQKVAAQAQLAETAVAVWEKKLAAKDGEQRMAALHARIKALKQEVRNAIQALED